MASEYLMQKAKREAVPEPPPREYTRKEKAANWLHYNKIWIITAAVLIWIVGSMLWNVLGIGQVQPDVTIAYVGSREISDQDAAALEDALAALGQDLNGDGKVTVRFLRYRLNHGGDAETALYFRYAADTALIADITAADSVFFLTENPKGVQRSYQIFANDDGTPPEDADYEAMDKVYPWFGCPALAALGLDDGFCSDLYIGRRGFYNEKQAAKHVGTDEIWASITQGATR